MGGFGGRMAGNLIGHAEAGGQAGTGLGAAISRWLGAGDYSIQSNSLVGSVKASGNIPMMHKSEQSIIIRHREYVGEVISNTAFTVRYALPVNPGMKASFPWLSRIAGNFQQYKIRGMVYHYIPTSGSAVASTNNALGSVMMQTTYRASDGPPLSKVTMLNEYWSNEAMPSETFAHPIECNPDENPFNVQYVRSQAVPAEDNRLLYDLGTTYVAVSGQQASNVVLGDLWVTYEVELKKPVLETNVVSNGDYVGFQCVGNTGTNFFGNFTRQFGDMPYVGPSFTTNGQIDIPAGIGGYFAVYVTVVITAVSFTGPVSWILGGGITFNGCISAQLPTGGTRVELSLPIGASYGNKLGTIAFGVFKENASSDASVVLPAIVAGAGAPTFTTYLTLWRTDQIMSNVGDVPFVKVL